MSLLLPFANFVTSVVLPNNQSYRRWLSSADCVAELRELQTEYQQAFGADPFEIALDNRGAAIAQIEQNLSTKGGSSFADYNELRGKGIPNALLNTHLLQFVKWYERVLLFQDLQAFVDKINEALSPAFCRKFQETRIKLNGNERVAANARVFTDVVDNSWTINRGGEREVQMHLAWDDDCVYYGLGFNAQKSRSNLEALRLAIPFATAFWNNEVAIRNLLPDFHFLDDGEHKLRALKEGNFVCFGKKIAFHESDTEHGSYEISGIDFLSLIYDLKQRLFNAYQLIFQQSQTVNYVNAMNQERIKLLKHKSQIILQGPPGTGKTRAAQEVAFGMVFGKSLRNDTQGRLEDLALLAQSGQYTIVQFHPAYSYEDFVRGISATTSGGQISYEVENRTITSIAKQALTNWENTQRLPDENTRRQQVSKWIEQWKLSLDERLASGEMVKLTDGTVIVKTTPEGIRYDGINNWKVDGGVPFRDILEMYLSAVSSRDEVKALNTLTQSAKSNSTYWWYMIEMFRQYLRTENVDENQSAAPAAEAVKNYVLIVDEINRANLPAVLGELIYALEYRNQPVASLYSHTIDGSQIVIPPNLFIIGTMNTADRSVGHIDYAIRRRFAFVDVLPSKEPVHSLAQKLFQKVSELFIKNYEAIDDWQKPKLERSMHLAPDFRPEDVWLGHSYFITDAVDDNEAREILTLKRDYEILPILKEYLRDGVLLTSTEPIITSLANEAFQTQ